MACENDSVSSCSWAIATSHHTIVVVSGDQCSACLGDVCGHIGGRHFGAHGLENLTQKGWMDASQGQLDV